MSGVLDTGPRLPPPKRIWLVGNSASGKSTFGRRLAAALSLPYIELDALNHQPNWTELSPDELREAIVGALDGAPDGWVVDGNYVGKVGTVVADRAEAVVWFDLPRRVVMRQVVTRSFARAWTREELWNGNRERWSALLHPDPRRSIIAWAWTEHASYHQRYVDLSDQRRDLRWLRIQTLADREIALNTLTRPHST